MESDKRINGSRSGLSQRALGFDEIQLAKFALPVANTGDAGSLLRRSKRWPCGSSSRLYGISEIGSRLFDFLLSVEFGGAAQGSRSVALGAGLCNRRSATVEERQRYGDAKHCRNAVTDRHAAYPRGHSHVRQALCAGKAKLGLSRIFAGACSSDSQTTATLRRLWSVSADTVKPCLIECIGHRSADPAAKIGPR